MRKEQYPTAADYRDALRREQVHKAAGYDFIQWRWRLDGRRYELTVVVNGETKVLS